LLGVHDETDLTIVTLDSTQHGLVTAPFNCSGFRHDDDDDMTDRDRDVSEVHLLGYRNVLISSSQAKPIRALWINRMPLILICSIAWDADIWIGQKWVLLPEIFTLELLTSLHLFLEALKEALLSGLPNLQTEKMMFGIKW